MFSLEEIPLCETSVHFIIIKSVLKYIPWGYGLGDFLTPSDTKRLDIFCSKDHFKGSNKVFST